MSIRTGKERGGERERQTDRKGGKGRVLTLIPLLRIVCATNNSRRPSNPSQWSAAAGRQAGRQAGGGGARRSELRL